MYTTDDLFRLVDDSSTMTKLLQRFKQLKAMITEVPKLNLE
ncbi:hypothetical protein Godav_021677 [Gossypium davidsonii]|uniref:Uncharacterized protein n=1 Tax=Gossypium davidsonii TaxID=34287 RepID=A0A7J8R7C3_GOSDV|nr:hypothetical protein [Gossypium davidsonii]